MSVFPIIYILAFIALVGIVIFRWWYNSPEEKGKRGEESVQNILSQLPKGYAVLSDVVIATERGTTQIDHIVISQYGVFVIETKNYSGSIYGNDNQRQWTQVIVTDVIYRRKWYKTYTYVTKNNFYNPVKQSLGHLFEVKKNLSEWQNLKIYPIIVFTGDADISNVHSNYSVIYDSELVSTIISHQTMCLSEDEVIRVIDRLCDKNIRSVIDNKTHIQNIYANKKDFALKVKSGICPKCGGTLIPRTGRYGSFYGCSNYPRCKFTTH